MINKVWYNMSYFNIIIVVLIHFDCSQVDDK